MRVENVNVGGRSRLSFDGDALETGIFKAPRAEPVHVTVTGIRGDVQVDRKNHGGPDKALCAYCADHFAAWRAEGYDVGPGTFGENLTISGLSERDVHVGDIFAAGEAVLQVSQPRQPCHKLSRKIGDPDFATRVIDCGRTGFYFRVMEPGTVQAGDALALRSSGPSRCTIEFANDVMYGRNTEQDALERLLAEDALADAWRRVLAVRRR